MLNACTCSAPVAINSAKAFKIVFMVIPCLLKIIGIVDARANAPTGDQHGKVRFDGHDFEVRIRKHAHAPILLGLKKLQQPIAVPNLGLAAFRDREPQVFRLIRQGRSARQIAETLPRSAKMIESHSLLLTPYSLLLSS